MSTVKNIAGDDKILYRFSDAKTGNMIDMFSASKGISEESLQQALKEKKEELEAVHGSVNVVKLEKILG